MDSQTTSKSEPNKNTEPQQNHKTNPEPAKSVKSGRLLSLDALRGFDMLMIIGGSGLVHKASQLNEWSWLNWLDKQMKHAPWHGFTFYDIIFPLFLFAIYN